MSHLNKMEEYSNKVMDHFMNPRNVGEIPDADGVGQVGNPVCGDIMKYIQIAQFLNSVNTHWVKTIWYHN